MSNNEWKAIGWPWSITIGNELIRQTEYADLADYSESKTRLSPRKFCELLNCKWVWKASINHVFFPEVNPGTMLEYSIVNSNNAIKIFCESGLEYYRMNMLFDGEEVIFDYKGVLTQLLVEIGSTKISGDIWDNRELLIKYITRL